MRYLFGNGPARMAPYLLVAPGLFLYLLVAMGPSLATVVTSWLGAPVKTLTTIEEASRKRKGETIDPETHKQIYAAIHAGYTEQQSITHAAARGWVDRMIEPARTREELIAALDAANAGWDYSKPFKTGVLQT